MKRIIAVLALLGQMSYTKAIAETMSVNEYIEKVKSSNPQAVSMIKNVDALKERLNEGSLITTPEFFAKYLIMDDRQPALIPGIQPSRVKAEGYNLGVRGQTAMGLNAGLSIEKSNQRLEGLSPTFPIVNPYNDTLAKLDLKQSLWRNGFGEKTRADRDQLTLLVKSQYESASFNLEQFLLTAENNYWALSSFEEIVNLQKENLENAKKTNNWMQGRVRQRLFDDVDGLQTQAAFESRQLEYEASLDEKKALERQFEKYTNIPWKQIQLEPIANYKVPTPNSVSEMTGNGIFDSQKSLTASQKAQAKSRRSEVRPQLDVVASVALRGREAETSNSWEELQDGKHPTWQVGVEFAAPLDFSFLGRIRKGYDTQIKAADQAIEAVDYESSRTKTDLLAQTMDAKNRLKRAQDLEVVSQKIIQKERVRHRNGRTTTFQLLKSEQDFASAQIQRVRAQLAFIQLNNALRLFNEEL